jgi:hypothetical protein
MEYKELPERTTMNMFDIDIEKSNDDYTFTILKEEGFKMIKVSTNAKAVLLFESLKLMELQNRQHK